MSQQDMRPNFGLGDATIAETVRIEWLSGIVQELRDVPVNQMLTAIEPPALEPTVTLAERSVELRIRSWIGFTYHIDASSDLNTWTHLSTLTNLTGSLQFTDPTASDLGPRFYRVRAE